MELLSAQMLVFWLVYWSVCDLVFGLVLELVGLT
jgi:hypothetical protein